MRYEAFSDKNPLLRPVRELAESARENRRPVSADNPFLFHPVDPRCCGSLSPTAQTDRGAVEPLLNDVENRKADDRRINVEFGQKRRVYFSTEGGPHLLTGSSD